MTALAMWGVEFAGGESWRILSHMMARGIDISTGRPIGNTTRFLTTDELAACWFEMEIEGFGPLMLTWRWFEPGGTVNREHSSVQLVPHRGVYRFWDVLRIRDTPVEARLGRWMAEVYVRAEELFSTFFLVEPQVTPYYVQVKVSGFDKEFFTGLCVDSVKVGTIVGGETRELTFRVGTTHIVSVDEYVPGRIGVRFYCSPSSVSVSGESSYLFLYGTEYYLKVWSLNMVSPRERDGIRRGPWRPSPSRRL